MTSRLQVLGTVAALLPGCQEQPPPDPVEHAAFGVLFGGQVQQLDEIPFELDRARQTLGFRLDFRDGLKQPSDVTWELDVPLPPSMSARARRAQGKEAPRASDRTLRRGQAKVPAGSRRFEQVLVLEPGDPLGTWNIQVRLNAESVIDRPFLLYDADARLRANDSTTSQNGLGR